MSFWWQLLFRCPFRCKFWELLKWEIYVDVHLMSFLMILLTEQMISISIRCEFWELPNWESYFDVHLDVSFGSCLTEKVMLMPIWCHFCWSYWLSKWFRCQFWGQFREVQDCESDFDVHVDVSSGSCRTGKVISMCISM